MIGTSSSMTIYSSLEIICMSWGMTQSLGPSQHFWGPHRYGLTILSWRCVATSISDYISPRIFSRFSREDILWKRCSHAAEWTMARALLPIPRLTFFRFLAFTKHFDLWRLVISELCANSLSSWVYELPLRRGLGERRSQISEKVHHREREKTSYRTSSVKHDTCFTNLARVGQHFDEVCLYLGFSKGTRNNFYICRQLFSAASLN